MFSLSFCFLGELLLSRGAYYRSETIISGERGSDPRHRLIHVALNQSLMLFLTQGCAFEALVGPRSVQIDSSVQLYRECLMVICAMSTVRAFVCVSAQGPFVRGVVGQCTECPCTHPQSAVAVPLPSLVTSLRLGVRVGL